MKIIMIHPHDIFHPQEPWTTRIRNIATELHRFGHEVKLVCHYFSKPHAIPMLASNIPISVTQFARGMMAWPANIRKLTGYLRWCDVVHLQKSIPYATIPLMIALARVPRRVHYDWDDWESAIYSIEYRQRAPFWLRHLEGIFPRYADTISYASHQIKELLMEIGYPEPLTAHATVGVDLKHFHPQTSGADEIRCRYDVTGKLVIYMGQLHAAQYAELYLHAARDVLRVLPDTRFLLVGDGWDKPRLMELAGELGVMGPLVFTGSVPHESIPDYLAAADIGVVSLEDNPATRAKSPLKIVEYLASGLAVVASGVGDVPFMIGDGGVVVPPGDSMAIAQALIQLLTDDNRLQQTKQLARKRAETCFDWAVIAKRIEALYRIDLPIQPAKLRMPGKVRGVW